MEIKFENKLGVILSEKENKILIPVSAVKDGAGYSVVWSNDAVQNTFSITKPGEYEIGGVSITAQSSAMDENVDIVEFVVENISIVVTRPSFKYSKLIHDNLGQINVLITEVESAKSYSELLNKLDPEIFMVYGAKELKTEALNMTGINNVETLGKLKLDAERFGNEEFILETYSLE